MLLLCLYAKWHNRLCVLTHILCNNTSQALQKIFLGKFWVSLHAAILLTPDAFALCRRR